MKLTENDILTVENKIIKTDNDNNIEMPDFKDDNYFLYNEKITIEVINDSPDDIFLNEQYHKMLYKSINDIIPFECQINTNNILYNCYNCFPCGKQIDAGINIYTILCAKIEKIRI